MTIDKPAGALPLSAGRWRLDAAKIPSSGAEIALAADAAELTALSRALDLIRLESFSLTGRLEPLSRGRFRLRARLEAHAVQSCVATLEPVDAEIAEEMDVEFAPPEAIATPGRQIDIDPEAEVAEPIENGHLEIGRLAYETLSVALPPYPRSETAIGLDASVADPPPAGPFAVLRSLKRPT